MEIEGAAQNRAMPSFMTIQPSEAAGGDLSFMAQTQPDLSVMHAELDVQRQADTYDDVATHPDYSID